MMPSRSLKKKLQKKEKDADDSSSYSTVSSSDIEKDMKDTKRKEKYRLPDKSGWSEKEKKSRNPPSPLTEMTFTEETDTITSNAQTEEEINLFNSKKERNKFLSKILLKSKKKIYKLAGCFLTPFLLLKLIMPDLPFF